MIRGECHSDDHAIKAEFDATPYFAQASDDELRKLAACDFGGDYAADDVAHFMREKSAKVRRMFDHIETAELGFECNVEIEDAMDWIKRNRPALFAELA